MVHKVIKIHILQKPSLSGRKNMVIVLIIYSFRDMIILSASGAGNLISCGYIDSGSARAWIALLILMLA